MAIFLLYILTLCSSLEILLVFFPRNTKPVIFNFPSSNECAGHFKIVTPLVR